MHRRSEITGGPFAPIEIDARSLLWVFDSSGHTAGGLPIRVMKLSGDWPQETLHVTSANAGVTWVSVMTNVYEVVVLDGMGEPISESAVVLFVRGIHLMDFVGPPRRFRHRPLGQLIQVVGDSRGLGRRGLVLKSVHAHPGQSPFELAGQVAGSCREPVLRSGDAPERFQGIARKRIPAALLGANHFNAVLLCLLLVQELANPRAKHLKLRLQPIRELSGT